MKQLFTLLLCLGPLLRGAGSNPLIDPTSMGRKSVAERDVAISVASVTALREIVFAGFSTNASAIVLGHYTTNDGGGGLYIYNPASTAADNGGTIIAPAVGLGRWLLSYSGPVNVRWFGAKGDGLSNDTTPVTAAYKALAASSPRGGVLYFPPGTYLFNLALAGGANVNIQGEPGSTTFRSWTPSGYVLTLTGYSTVLDRTYFRDFRIQGVPGTNGIYLQTTSAALENVWINGTDICVYIFQCTAHHFTNCRFYGKNYAIVMKGSVSGGSPSYSGFSIFDDVRVGAGKCAIYADNTAFAGGGGNVYRKVWCEGFPGIFFYGNEASAYYAPDFFQDLWLEKIATAKAINLSDVGGPASVAVEGKAMFFVSSSAHCSYITYPFSAVSYSNINLDQYNSESGTPWTADTSSSVVVNEVTTGGNNLYIPYVCRDLVPKEGHGITTLNDTIRDTLDYSLVNLLGLTGDGVADFSESGGAGTFCSIVEDDTAPVFNKVLSMVIPSRESLTLYTYTTRGQGDTYLSQTAGHWYAYSYYINISAGNFIGPNWTNILPVPSNLSFRQWHHISGIFRCSTSNANRDFPIQNNGSATAIFKMSQIQLVDFTDGDEARQFLASKRYAASYPGFPGVPNYSLMLYKRRTMFGSGAPSMNALFIGQQYLDCAHKKWYQSVAVGSGPLDWVALN
jgi:hypothetical protein